MAFFCDWFYHQKSEIEGEKWMGERTQERRGNRFVNEFFLEFFYLLFG